MNRFRQVTVKLGILLLLAVSTTNLNAYAYESIKLRNSIDPGAVFNTSPLPYFSQTIESQKSGEIKNQDSTETEKPMVLYNTRFYVNNVVFNGNTKIKTEVLQDLSQELLEKEVTLDEIKKVTAKITKLYRDKGYLTSVAYVAPQKIKDGTLEITVLEGKIGDINIKGAKWTRKSYIENNILKANNFSEDNVFNINHLKKSLADINNTGYLKGQVTLQKGSEPETTDIILDVKDKFPINLGVSWDNAGRDLIGIQRGSITLIDRNLTGFGDSIYTGVSLASGTTGVNTGYSVPLGPYGTKLKFGYMFSRVDLGGDYKRYNIDGSSHLFNTAIIQPLYKGNKFNLLSDVSLDMIHSRTTLQDSVKLQGYELRVLRYGLTGIRDDLSGRWISRAEISTGLPFLGGTSESSRGVGSSKFFKTIANLTRIQALPFRTTGIFRINGQISPDAMLAPEQMQIGGMYSVRGYDEGLILGDIGFNASLELRRPVPYLPSFSVPYWPNRHLDVNLRDKIHIAAFYDFGGARTIHQSKEMRISKFLHSIGLGLRINLTKYIMANIDLGFPLANKDCLNQNSIKVHFGISSNLI